MSARPDACTDRLSWKGECQEERGALSALLSIRPHSYLNAKLLVGREGAYQSSVELHAVIHVRGIHHLYR